MDYASTVLMLTLVGNQALLPEGSNDLGTLRRLTAGAMAGVTSVSKYLKFAS